MSRNRQKQNSHVEAALAGAAEKKTNGGCSEHSVQPEPKKRGVYLQENGKVLIVFWDDEHPRPPIQLWHYCEQCDFKHPDGGHIKVRYQDGFIFFVPDDLKQQLEEVLEALR